MNTLDDLSRQIDVILIQLNVLDHRLDALSARVSMQASESAARFSAVHLSPAEAPKGPALSEEDIVRKIAAWLRDYHLGPNIPSAIARLVADAIERGDWR